MATCGSNQKTWTIVKFLEENSVAMVPTAWIITDSGNGDTCFWPPLPPEKLSLAVKNHQIDTCWPSYKISIFRNATYDNYQAARRAALKAEDTSDLNTDTDTKKRKRIVKTLSSSSSDEDESEVLIKIKSPPKFNGVHLNRSNHKKVKEAKRNLGSAVQLVEGVQHKEAKLLNNRKTLSQDKTLISDDENAPFDDALKENELNYSLDLRVGNENEPKTKTTQNDCTCCPLHVHYMKEILRQVLFVKSRVNDIPTEPLMSSSLAHFPQEKPLLFEKPATNCEAFSEINEQLLNDKDFFEQAVHELSKMGARNSYDFTSRCLKKIISNEVASEYSWLGRRTKKNFSETHVSKLIIAAAEAGGKAKDRKEVEDAISGWLRRANDRLKSNKKT